MGHCQEEIRLSRPSLKRVIPLLPVFLLCTTLRSAPSDHRVRLGADVLLEKRLALVRGKRIGLITNQTGLTGSGERLLDALLSRGVRVTALFGPEHGIHGAGEAGESVAGGVDAKTRIPVFSLYGPNRKPTPAMLAGVDMLLYDLQDVGARFYTYISTLGLCMEAAAGKGIPIVVLDRPDPLGGLLTDGPLLPDSLRSFVGMFPVPVVYGLTVGELAEMANGEGWLAGGVRADITVIKMKGWTRSMPWSDTGLRWVPPSPNIRTPEAALAYTATCYLEATNVSEGRGTDSPFQIIGAPFIDGRDTAGLLSLRIPGLVEVRDTVFTPSLSKFSGVKCSGVRIELVMSGSLRPVRLGLRLLSLLTKTYRDSFNVSRIGLLHLLGDTEALDRIALGEVADSISARWEPSLRAFRARASMYHLYPER
jgi:uncharacterized protein YbbC (DUF1343 family)